MRTKFWLSFLTLIGLFLNTQTAQAQTYQPSNRIPVADSTLNTQVLGNGSTFDITGGLTKGQTLFHSFTDFSVPTNGAANFVNLTNPRDIISRVTGNSFSDINGLVNTNGANFFLINPNGIVFGTNAQLNVGRAFMASTANGINLVDSAGSAITFGTKTNGDALLKIAPNVLFNVSSLTMGGGNGQISNFGTLQTTNPNQYIGLIGGNVNINGGKIIAPGVRVDIGSLSALGTVTFGGQGDAQLPTNVARGDVSLTNGASVDVTGAGGGDIAISARNLEILGGSFVTGGIGSGLGSPATVAGDIKVNATGDVKLADISFIGNIVNTGAVGKGGAVEIDARNISLDGNGNGFRSGVFNAVDQNGIGTGGRIDITTGNLSVTNGAGLVASTLGQGDAGSLKITATGNILLDGFGNGLNTGVFSTVENGASGKGGGIEITTGNLSATNGAVLNAATFGKGDAGSIKVTATGNISFDSLGNGFSSGAFSTVQPGAEGKGGGIEITTGNLSATNGAVLNAATFGKGDAGSVKITATGNISFDGFVNGVPSGAFSNVQPEAVGNSGGVVINTRNLSVTNGARLFAGTVGQGDAGSVKIMATENVSFDGFGNGLPSGAFSTVEQGAVGNGGGVEINRGNLSVTNGAQLGASTFGQGDAGSIKITATGNVSFDGGAAFSTVEEGAEGKGGGINIIPMGNISVINGGRLDSSTKGQGDAGEISIETKGKLSVASNGIVVSGIFPTATGNSQGIKINTGELELINAGTIQTSSIQSNLVDGTGNAGNIDITTNGNLKIVGTTNPTVSRNVSGISSASIGSGNAGKITIDTQGNKLSLSNNAAIFSSIGIIGLGNSKGIQIDAGDVILTNNSRIDASNLIAQGNAGDIKITTTGNINVVLNSSISSGSFGQGQSANILIDSKQLNLNESQIFTNASSANGGNLTIDLRDRLLLRNNSSITTNSGSGEKNGNGGNITINSPLIVATPGNNDITANAYAGNGGKVDITSRGLFGIKFRPTGSDFTSDITSSSTFGQSGTVTIDTPGTDPGKDSTELPNTTTDASNQISQVCSASNRQNKLTVAGRGGLPPNANDPLTSDVVWQDARATSSQPAISSATTNPTKLAPPAVGWVFDGKGKVNLIAAATQGQPTGTRVVCPNVK